MKTIIQNQIITKVQHTPNYKGSLNRFRIFLKEGDETAIVYFFYRDKTKTRSYYVLLKVGNQLDAEITILQDPQSGGTSNIAMITKVIKSQSPKRLSASA